MDRDDTCTQDPDAALGCALSLAVVLPGAALAQEGFAGEGSGSATIAFDGDGGMADIQVDWQGLGAESPDLSGRNLEYSMSR